jgi:hypothetical protein
MGLPPAGPDQDVKFILFLCGYLQSGYLGYEAAEGIDWIWEHQMRALNECVADTPAGVH